MNKRAHTSPSLLLLWALTSHPASSFTSFPARPGAYSGRCAGAILSLIMLAAGFVYGDPTNGIKTRVEGGIAAVYLNAANKEAVLSLPQVNCGAVQVGWAELEPQKGKYDFSIFEKQLADYAKRGKRVMVEIIGYHKPHYLFNEVPYVKETGKEVSSFHQVLDKEGTLMFWHPTYERDFVNCLTAFRNDIAASPNKNSIIGMRMNFNPFGCENYKFYPASEGMKFADRNVWIRPPGLDGSIPYEGWSDREGAEYVKRITRKYFELFNGVVPLMVRHDALKEDYFSDYIGQLENGTCMLMKNDSLYVPYWNGSDWAPLLKYCKNGRTLAFTEPLANAWGVRLIKDTYSLPPVQTFYWRLLCDLHLGVSYIACYANDLLVATTGEYDSKKYNIHHSDKETGENFKGEFTEALNFAARYAGYHAKPELSPGAWIALRDSDKTANAGKPNNKLKDLTDDFTFLMERVPDKSCGVMHIGSDAVRYGGYARELPANESMRFKLNEKFASSIAGKPVALSVIYFSDSPGGSFTISAGDKSFPVAMKDGKKWQSATFEINGSLLSQKDGVNIAIRSGSVPLTLHLVEVKRVNE